MSDLTGIDIQKDLDVLMHYGTPEHSGRYPWGSGEHPYQRLEEGGCGSFMARYNELKKSGMAESEIAKDMGFKSTNDLRDRKSYEGMMEKQYKYFMCNELKEKGLTNVDIAKRLNMTEPSVRNYLKEGKFEKISQLQNVADQLEHEVKKKKYLDVGEGSNLSLNCTDTRMRAAISMLREKGYEYHTLYVDQLGTNHKTTMTILCKPGTDIKYLYKNMDKIHGIDETRRIDIDDTVKLGAVNPKSVSRDRIMVRYGDEGGSDMDGVIELRRGVDDISLGKANYAQVRIAVDDKAYMKGMAIYNDNMPKGVDIIYNTNKKKGAPDFGDGGVFKTMKKEDANPFGATIKGLYDEDRGPEDKELKLTQRYYIDKEGNKQLSCINVVNEEGTWTNWSKSLSSQFLSKQSVPLAKRQLDLSYKGSVDDFTDIMKITEPTVRKKMLEDFAEQCDAAAVDLKAAALPRQRTHVILPVPTLKDNEIYAPNYRQGETIALIRYPHGGTFEIPVLKNNKNHKDGKSIVGNSQDALGINIKTAEQLSGADFDGDTVVAIPIDNIKLTTQNPREHPALKSLLDFDPKSYKLPDTKHVNPKTGKEEYDFPKISNRTKQLEMGKVSNLITDMTIQGAPPEDIVRAVKHSMVVIDSEKHHLDYKKSEKDQRIAELKKRYQGGGGAYTIVSRASAQFDADETRAYKKIDPETGKLIKEKTNKQHEVIKKSIDPVTGEKTYIHTGKYKDNKVKSTRMAETDDAFTLTSDGTGTTYPMERVYATYANQMKALANRSRKESLGVVDREYSPSAAKTYEKEVDSLKTKLLIAQKNAPRERQAQLLGNSKVKQQLLDHPEWKDDNDRMKKVRGQALTAARAACGAKAEPIHFTDKEWEAIQAGAIRKSMLKDIIQRADKDEVTKRSMPKTTTITNAKRSRIKALYASGMTQSDIADMLGISMTTVGNIVAE